MYKEFYFSQARKLVRINSRLAGSKGLAQPIHVSTISRYIKSMAAFWRQILSRVLGTAQHTATTPEQTVRDFIRDFQAWNDRIWAMSKKSRQHNEGHELVYSRAESEYTSLVKKYYAGEVVAQPIAFGSDSMHQQSHEVIQAVDVEVYAATVRTKSTDAHNFVSNYEYHLVQEAGKWRIKSLLYVTDDGSYECL